MHIILLVNTALSQGYTILRSYEAIVYKQASPVMSEFFQKLAHFSLKYKSPGNQTIEDFTDKINKEMNTNLPDGLSKFKIDANDFNCKNCSNRDCFNCKYFKSFLKLHLNAILGKLMQRNRSSSKTVVIDSEEAFADYYDQITSIIDLDNCDMILAILQEVKNGFHYVQPHKNVILGSYITAYGRILMHDLFQDLINMDRNIEFLYCDTDAGT